MYTPAPAVFTVSQLNSYVKSLIEGDDSISTLFVTGELSNFKHHSSGHMYMSLKDKESAVRAVMFANAASRLRFMPEDGMKVIIRGRASLYPKDGSFQIYIDDMQPDGLGALNMAYNQLKDKLENEGLFSAAHKKPLPQFPQRVGVITSPTGAAVRDILYVLKNRFPAAEVVLCPAAVQGDGAAQELANTVKRVNAEKAADVIIIGRGGGSLEDLWAFNEEVLARAIYGSDIPVISGVGHETDFTICDFVADYRAPTPTAAAQAAVPDANEIKAYLRGAQSFLANSVKKDISARRLEVKALAANRHLRSCRAYTDDARQNVFSLKLRMDSALSARLTLEKERISGYNGRLEALSPQRVLERGYAAVFAENRIVTGTDGLSVGQNIRIELSNGELEAHILSLKRKD